jgi:hypothetical protein
VTKRATVANADGSAEAVISRLLYKVTMPMRCNAAAL